MSVDYIGAQNIEKKHCKCADQAGKRKAGIQTKKKTQSGKNRNRAGN